MVGAVIIYAIVEVNAGLDTALHRTNRIGLLTGLGLGLGLVIAPYVAVLMNPCKGTIIHRARLALGVMLFTAVAAGVGVAISVIAPVSMMSMGHCGYTYCPNEHCECH